jgi:uncharacterized membrane protein YraQ (UPF0718 family)
VGQFWDFLHTALGLYLELAPLLLIGFLVAGAIHALVPERLIGSWLGTPGFGSIARASAVGVPLPLCSCSVIPVAVQLRNGGATRGATASFLVSTPETGVDSIAASVAVFHPLLVIVRPIAALGTAVVTGLAVERFAGPETGATAAPTGCCHCGSEADDPPEAPRSASPSVGASDQTLGFLPGPTRTSAAARRLRSTLRHAFVDLFGEIGPWLIPAILVTAALTSLLDPSLVANTVGGARWLQMLVLLVVGIPVYVCATAATPVAAGLIAVGFSPGSALVFLLVGPATNLVTLRAAAATLGVRGAWAYGLSVALVSLAFGVGIDLLVDATGLAPTALADVGAHDHKSPLQIAGAVLFTALVLWHIARRFRRG